MKISFKAKIIFESDKFAESSSESISPEPITIVKMLEAIGTGNCKIEVINDELTRDYEPVIIFTYNK